MSAEKIHCMFSVKLLENEDPDVTHVSRLSFIDLASFESSSETRTKGDSLKDDINKSLTTLKRCLECQHRKQRHLNSQRIPVRETKLTHLFEDLFSGKTKASFIINVKRRIFIYEEIIPVMRHLAISKETAIRKSTRENYPAPKKAELDSKPERHSVPWAGKILSTPEPEPQDDIKIQKEVELDDEEVEAPTTTTRVDLELREVEEDDEEFEAPTTTTRESNRQNYPAERHSVPWAGKILSTPEPEPQDDLELREVEEDDEEFEAPTATTTVSKPLQRAPPDEVHEVDTQEEQNRALTAELCACQQATPQDLETLEVNGFVKEVERRLCKKPTKPARGAFLSSWYKWSICTCIDGVQKQTRKRICSNGNCSGENSETKECSDPTAKGCGQGSN